MEWPDGKKFAFTIIDDTDNSTIKNTKPVYDLLVSQGMLTTKTVWVYPPRDGFTGQSLSQPEYLEFIKWLHDIGMDIALHNVGSGSFKRNEIKEGVELFKDWLGFYPNIQINHSNNKDNIYWGSERYVFPFRSLVKYRYGKEREFYGNDESSRFFWGDICKKHIKYIRNHCFNGINTLRYDPDMPYINKDKQKYSNYWFSSSDGHTVEEFNSLISQHNVNKLEREHGACIVYTHFAAGFVDKSGNLNPDFEDRIKYLAGRNGWFVPASVLLDRLLDNKNSNTVSYGYLRRLDMLWVIERVLKKIKYGR